MTGITSSDVTTALGFTPENAANKGVNNGYASLDGGGKVPSSQLPSYVDDVIEVSSYGTLPTTGETGKIYITLDTNKIYRWSGSVYVEVSSSAAVWGGITGTLSNQTDLQTALDAKQDDLNGTGFVKASGTTISYDNTVYYPDSNPDGYTSNTGTVTSVALSVPSAFSVSGSPITSSGTLAITGAGTTAQYVRGDGTLATLPDISGFVPYTGATGNVDLGTHTIIAAKGTFSSSGSADTVGITHSSGSGIALNISKAGNGEGIYVNKTSGSGNAVTIVGTLNATTLVKNGGTSTQFLKADGSVDSSTYLTSASLSGYVDTSSDQTISGVKTFTGFGLFSNTLHLKQDTNISFLSGYNSIDASASSIFLGLPNTYGANLVLSSLTAQRNFTFPDAAGTIALTSDIPSLSGYVDTTTSQSIGGTKTFTGNVKLDGDLYFKQENSFSPITGYSAITADSGGFFLFRDNTSSWAYLSLTSLTSSRNFTFPDATGTLALTSQLHDAVTIGTANGLSLSTQVLSLALASTSATGALSSTDWNTFNGKQNALTNPVTGTGTSSYLPKFTGTTTIGNSLLYDTGSVLLVGATSASNASSKLELVSSSTVGLKIISSGANGNNTFLSIESSKEWRFLTNRGDLIAGNQGDLIIRNNTDGINHIILNQGGSTTFYGALSGTTATFTTGVSSTNGYGFTSSLGSENITFSNSWFGGIDAIYQNSGNNNDFGIYLNGGTSTQAKLYITNSGNVGIGTTAPARTLDVTGTFRVVTPNRSFFVTSNAYSISDGTLSSGIGMDGDGLYLGNVTSSSGWTISNPQVMIKSNGNVGIGTTAPDRDPSGTRSLAVSGGGSLAASLDLYGNARNFAIFTGGAGGLGFFDLTAGSERMRITSAGNVGIGTTAPFSFGSDNKTLEIRGGGTGSIGALFVANSDRSAVLGFYINPGATGTVGTSSNHALQLVTNDLERMRITSGGNVLVGTTTDSGAKLRVSGLNQSSSFVTDYGNASIPFGSYGTFYTVSNYQNALYMVTLQYNGYSGYTAYAIIAQNDSALVVMHQVNNNAQIQVSGLNIQGKNDSGVTVSMVYKIIKIG